MVLTQTAFKSLDAKRGQVQQKNTLNPSSAIKRLKGRTVEENFPMDFIPLCV